MDNKKKLKITIQSFPFPPQLSKLYNSFYKNGKVNKVKSKEYTQYLKEVNAYHWARESEFREARDALKEFESFKMTYYVMFPYSKVFTKKGALKKCDVSNREKALSDSLATCLGIDDQRFNNVELIKCVATSEANPKVIIIIEPMKILTESEVLELILLPKKQ